MRIIAISRGYDIRGGAAITDVTAYLQRFFAPVPPADLMLEIESFHLSTEPTRHSEIESLYISAEARRLNLEPSRIRFESDYKSLPRLRFLRKANRITFHYPSKLPSHVAFTRGKTDPRTFRAVLIELRDAIETSFSSSRSLRAAVDVLVLKNGIADAIEQLPHHDERLNRLIDEIKAERQAERLRPMTMERLPVDWSRFHPSARTILNDPFFWDEVDDDAPHGNDTGADLLPAFRRWRARNRTTSPLHFMDLLLKKWGLLHDDQTVTEAKIGLAFAQIKLEGRCDRTVAARAIAAIDHRLTSVANDPNRESKFRCLREHLLLLSNEDLAE